MGLFVRVKWVGFDPLLLFHLEFKVCEIVAMCFKIWIFTRNTPQTHYNFMLSPNEQTFLDVAKIKKVTQS